MRIRRCSDCERVLPMSERDDCLVCPRCSTQQAQELVA